MTYQRALQRISTLMAVITVTLVLLAGATGALLAYYYEPTAGGAYRSLQFISREIAGGSLVRSLHDIAGNGLIGVALVQLVLLFLGREFRPAWFTAWVSGVLLAVIGIALGWTAIILDWEQISFWRLKIELGIIGSLPVIGDSLRAILTGGDGINTLTVQHLYTLHSYLLPVLAIALATLHLVALVLQERTHRLEQLAAGSPVQPTSLPPDHTPGSEAPV